MWLPDNFTEVIIRLVMAIILGGIIGFERTGTNHNAGLRTHIIVCLGATAVMIMSEAIHLSYGGDIGRIGAQVVSGIGFLGAGCILVNGNRISGLTTAAGLWTTACVGLAIGLGYYFIAIVTAGLVLFSMIVLHPITARLQKKTLRDDFSIRIYTNSRESIDMISDYIYKHEYKLSAVSIEDDCTLLIRFQNDTEENVNHLIFRLMKINGIQRIEKL